MNLQRSVDKVEMFGSEKTYLRLDQTASVKEAKLD